MSDNTTICVSNSVPKRRFLLGAALTLGAATFATTAVQAQSAAPTNNQLLNLALNINYLYGQYLNYGLYGSALDPSTTRGIDLGSVSGGPVTGARKVTSVDATSNVALRAVASLNDAQRSTLRAVLFSSLVAQPAIDLSPATFTTLMRASGAIGPADTFDPYASADNFILGAYLIADLSVTAEQGFASRITDEMVLAISLAAASAKAAGAAVIRSLLYRRGLVVPSVFTAADRISAQRDRYDGVTTLDAGLSPKTIAGARVSRIVPGNVDALIPARSPEQVLNVLYMTNAAVSKGGFFPDGVNGTLRTSSAN